MKAHKIAYVHHYGGSGGASNSLYQLLRALPGEKYEFHIITPEGPVVDLFKQVTPHVYVLPGGAPPLFYSVQGIDYLTPRMLLSSLTKRKVNDEVMQLITKINPDLVHLNDNGLVLLAQRLKKAGYPVVLHARCGPRKNATTINGIVNRYINKYVDKLICISGSVANGFDQVAGERKMIVYNSFHLESTRDAKIVRAPGSAFNCLFLANFLTYKGILETVEAAVLLKDYSDIHFYLAGQNARSNAYFSSILGRFLDWTTLYLNVEKKIQETITQYGLTNIHLLGYVKDIDSLLSNTHLNLAPMRLNAPPRSVFEAGMYGIPSILALQDRVEDMVIDGENGLIIPERNPKILADTILRFYNNENDRKRMGRNAVIQFSRLNDPHRAAKVVDRLYCQLVTACDDCEPLVSSN